MFNLGEKMLNSIVMVAAILLGGYVFKQLRNWKQGLLWSVLFYLLTSTLILMVSMFGLLVVKADPLKSISQSVMLAVIGPALGAWLLRLITKKKTTTE